MSDDENGAAFEARMKDIVVHGYILVGVSVGAKLGLFEAMSNITQPFNVADLASETHCKERYIKEWLHHMVVSDIVDVDESGTQYTLPENRVNALTSPDQPVMSIGGSFPYVMLPHRELMECFKEDGPNGLPFTAGKILYDERQLSPKKRKNILQCADGIILAIHGMRASSLEAGIVALDVGSGDGLMLCHVAAQFPNSRFVGFDYSADQVQEGAERAKKDALTNVEFYQQDACNISADWLDTFDVAWMHEALHDMPFASTCLSEIYKSLKPGGQLAVFEFTCSSNPFVNRKEPLYRSRCETLLPVSLYHCLPTSMATPGSEAHGACAGMEAISRLIQQAGFDLEKVEPTPNTDKSLFLCKKSTC